jgi:hypothetical protein
LDSRKLDSQDKQAVSPGFELNFDGEEAPCPFRLVIHPTPKNDGRRGSGFKKSKGKGRIELKCEATERPSDSPELAFRFAIGMGTVKQPFRSEVSSNFCENSCCGMPKTEEEWDFSVAVDPESKTFLVVVEVQTEMSKDQQDQ